MRAILLLSVLLINQIGFAQIPTTGLDGQYKFINGSLNDSFGTNHLTQTGSLLNNVDDRFSAAANAVNLSGDYLQRSSIQGTTNMSISFWIKTSTTDANIRTIIDQTERNSDVNNTSERGWYAYLQNGKVGLYSNYLFNYQNSSGTTVTGNTGYYNLATNVNVADNNWHHVVITIKGRVYFWQSSHWVLENEYTIYIDNVLKNNYLHNTPTYSTGWANSPNTFPNVPVTIGNIQTGNLSSTNNYTDTIDDIRIYKGTVLTAANVNSLFVENPLTRFYVNQNATGANNGSSWSDAYTSLTTALNFTTDQEIWIAEGVYTPHTTDRSTSFTINVPGIKIYGGFSGTETQLSDRVIGAHETILSGDLLSNDDTNVTYVNTSRNDNSYTVVNILSDNIELNGLTISDGHANGGTGSATEARYGGGIHKNANTRNLTIKNCKVIRNVSKEAGGAISSGFGATGGTSSLIINASEFSENLSAIGGVIYSASTGTTTVNYSISNSLFSKNRANDTSGAATGYAGSSMWLRAYNNSSTMITNIVNCTFVDNVDEGTASGMTNTNRTTLALTKNTSANHSATLINCVFWNNKTASSTQARPIGGFIESMISSATIKNSIDETNFTGVTLSGTSGNNNNSNPLFTNLAGGDYTLSNGSPAINSGDNSNVIGDIDILGMQRIYNSTVDMGAYEYGSTLSNDSFIIENNFTVYPNPATTKLNIVSNDELEKIEVYSLLGELVLSNQTKNIDVSHLQSGLYIVKVVFKTNAFKVEKFLKN